MKEPAVIVLAKAPVAGRVKTRLTPPCSPDEAAALAEAALADTLAAVAGTAASRKVVVLDGSAGPWIPAGFEVAPQVDGGLGNRIAGAFGAVGAPAVLIGMDTPQVTPGLLERAGRALSRPGVAAVIGAAEDGGYWAIGLTEVRPDAFRGVPMSRSWTARAQRARLAALGIRCAALPVLRDIDTIADARAVADAHPQLRLSAVLASVGAAGAACEPAAR
jgi:uncharacterized protein